MNLISLKMAGLDVIQSPHLHAVEYELYYCQDFVRYSAPKEDSET